MWSKKLANHYYVGHIVSKFFSQWSCQFIQVTPLYFALYMLEWCFIIFFHESSS